MTLVHMIKISLNFLKLFLKIPVDMAINLCYTNQAVARDSNLSIPYLNNLKKLRKISIDRLVTLWYTSQATTEW